MGSAATGHLCGGLGFVTSRDLGGAVAADMPALVSAALAHFGMDPEIDRVAWKVRLHDAFRGLPEALVAHGFVAEDAESIMVGRLEPVHGTEFVGIWGAATLEAYRGRGIYRALTAAPARSAMAQGKTLVHSDSS